MGSRREQIIRTAALLFRQFGFNGTSIEDIARKVNLPKGGIYNHIKSKEELLYEIITRGIRQFLPALREIKASEDDVREKFHRAVYTNVFTLATYHDLVGVFLQDKRSLSKRHYQEYIGYRDEVEQGFKGMIRQGMKERVFREGDVNLATFAVLGMCNWVTQWYREDGKFKAEEIATFFADAAERMLRP
jgi:AcrR family transcriptional regulator